MVPVRFLTRGINVTRTRYDSGGYARALPGNPTTPETGAGLYNPGRQVYPYYPSPIYPQYGSSTDLLGNAWSPYHIRDWTTGIEKPSYEISKPWLNVHEYP